MEKDDSINLLLNLTENPPDVPPAGEQTTDADFLDLMGAETMAPATDVVAAASEPITDPFVDLMGMETTSEDPIDAAPPVSEEPTDPFLDLTGGQEQVAAIEPEPIAALETPLLDRSNEEVKEEHVALKSPMDDTMETMEDNHFDSNQGNGSNGNAAAAVAVTAVAADKDEIVNLAGKTFDDPMYKIWNVAAPIVVNNLTVTKDVPSSSSSSSETPHQPPGAPNFATALLGTWMANNLNLTSPPPTPSTTVTTPGAPPIAAFHSSPYVLKDIPLLLLPGETTLIIGPSSSGKSTLLSTLSTLIQGIPPPPNVTASLTIGNDINPTSAPSSRYRRTATVVSQGDLTLTPVLTVRETVSFAIQCTEGISTDLASGAVERVLALFGLSHVGDTVVGDAEIRGVSGGQKRRVKTLEAACGSHLRVLMMDEITNGLDAASAASVCRVVKTACEKTGLCAVCALLQPSQEVFETFDKVVVLTATGDCAYSGTRKDAMLFFENEVGCRRPHGMDEPEFLLRAAYCPTAYTSAGQRGSVVSSRDVAQVFGRGSEAKEALRLQSLYAVTDYEERHKQLGEGGIVEEIPPFALKMGAQVKVLVGRGLKLVRRNPSNVQRVVSALIFGVFIGTLFLNTPGDATGTVTRSGYALTMLFMLFLTSCMSPLEDHFADRITFYAHRSANFYSTGAYYLANVLCNTPVTLLEALFLSALSFFPVGMSDRAFGPFLYFLALASMVNLNGLAISRILSYVLPTSDMAASLGPAVLLLFVLTAGYSPQYADLPVWLRWLSWLSPCAYAYEGMIINELSRRNVTINIMDVEGNTVDNVIMTGNDFGSDNLGVPRVPYSDAPSGLNTPQKVMTFDFFMLAILTILFESLGCWLLHKSQEWYGPRTKRYQTSSGMSIQTLPLQNLTPKELVQNKGRLSNRNVVAIPTAPRMQLTATQIVYDVDVKIDKKEDKKNKKKDTATKSGLTEPLLSPNEMDQPPVLSASPATLTSSLLTSLDVDDDQRRHRTARDYAQSHRGTAKNYLLSLTLGPSSLSSASVDTSRGPSKTSSVARDTLTSAVLEDREGIPPPPPGRLRLLSGTTACFSPGTLTALMGSSGAGKSTLLDVLAGYKTGGYIGGEVRLNGTLKDDKRFRAVAGYCEQVDCHNPALTVRESLYFASLMRLRPFGGESIKKKYAKEVMTLLELEEFADTLVGDEAAGEGLPKHARKRLTVGVELAANPSILFADEPTSGLDSISAKLVVDCLARAAQERGLTVVCTIHQPSREVFHSFDNLLLLRKGGITTYNGPISEIDNYILSVTSDQSLTLASSAGVNPADHILDVFCGPRGESYDWGDLYKKSAMAQAAWKAAHQSTSESGVPLGTDDLTTFSGPGGGGSAANSFGSPILPSGGVTGEKVVHQPFLTELWNVTYRQLLSHWRTPSYMAVRFWWTLVASLIVGFININSPSTVKGVQNRLGALFFYVNIATVPLMSAAVPLITERAVYYREVASGTYRKFVYGIAIQLAEIPFNMGAAILSWICFYFLVGLDTSMDRMGYFVLMALASYWLLPAFGQLFSFLSPNIGAATGLGSLLMTLFSLTMGFLIPADKIPPWYIWIYWLNPLRYMLQGTLVNEVGGEKWYAYTEPNGDTKHVSGDDLLQVFGWSFSERWWYCYVAVLMFAVATSVGIVLSTRISWLKR